MKPSMVLRCLSAAACFLWAVSLCTAASEPRRLDAGRVSWRAFQIGGSRLGNSVSTTIELAPVPAGAEKEFLASPRGTPFAAGTPQAAVLAVKTVIRPQAFSPVTLTSRVWFDPQSARPLQQIRWRRGQDDYDQTYRFTDEGVFRLQREPRSAAEAALPPDRWTKIDQKFYTLGARTGQATETSLLIYLLSALFRPEEGGAFNLTVFNKRQLFDVRLMPQPVQSLPVDFILKQGGRETRVQRTAQVLPIRMDSRTLDPGGKDADDFSFLGLKEDIVVFFENSSRFPIRVSGVIPGLGRIDLPLQEIEPSAAADAPAR
jgi:hypothetical protein